MSDIYPIVGEGEIRKNKSLETHEQDLQKKAEQGRKLKESLESPTGDLLVSHCLAQLHTMIDQVTSPGEEPDMDRDLAALERIRAIRTILQGIGFKVKLGEMAAGKLMELDLAKMNKST